VTTLVTGGTGFLGSAVVRALLASGEEVRALVRPSSDLRNLEGLDLERVVGDLREPDSLKRALAGCRTLYHVAADYRLWVPDPATLYAANVEGTRALMLAALSLGTERIVYTSSVATLGLHADGTPADEHTPVGLADMIGHYKRSKYLAEEAVRELARERQLPAVIVNPSAPVGPRDLKPTPTGRTVLDAAAGRMPAYVDTGLNIVHVDDVAAGHLLACRHGRVGERYILGGTDMSLKETLGTIADLVGRPPPRWRLPHAALLPVAHAAEAWSRWSGREPLLTVDGIRLARKHMYFTSARAHAELGYDARPARAALADAIAGFRALGYL
jgi:dihydroflavonol-4-reductase